MRFVQTRPSRGRRCRTLLAIFALGLLIAPTVATAYWDNGGWSEIETSLGSFAKLASATDGRGGSLLVVSDPDAPFRTVVVQRLDHTGTRLWGPDGVTMPYDLASLGNTGQAAICDDGAGGAYCVFVRIYTSGRYLTAAHVAADGSLSWVVPVDAINFQNHNIVPRMVPTGDGDAIVVWIRGNGAPDEEIMATRIDAAGTVVWNNLIWADSNAQIDDLWYEATADGQGGVLLGMNNYMNLTTYEKRVQRINGAGGVLWGAYGSLAWTGHGVIAGIVADGAGGAYIGSEAAYGQVLAQHFDAAGSATWIAGGVRILDVVTGSTSAYPRICGDGFGGLFAVAGENDLHGQRIDVAGTPHWGLTGLQLTTAASWQSNASIAHDGFGGLLVAYRDHSFSDPGDTQMRALSAKRFDHFGTQLWAHPGFWWSATAGMPFHWVASPDIVADGSGGLHATWMAVDVGSADRRFLAAGIGPAGASPPQPILQAITPDGGAGGDAVPVTILGDYIEPVHGFILERTGSPDLPVTALAGTGGRQVTGTLDLAGAHAGTYDLVLEIAAADVDVLADAFGVGDAPPCAGDQQLGTPGAALFAGSRRKVAFDELGQAHHVTLGYDSDNGTYHINLGTEIADSRWGIRLLDSPDYLRQVAFAAGPGTVRHIAFVKESGGVDRLMYIQVDENLTTYTHEMPVTDGVRNPVVAVDSTGTAHIVFESDIMGESWLFTTTATRGGFGGQTDIMSGAGATAPDLCRSTGGLTLAFVRDSWIPGWVEICRQRFDGASWSAPTGFYSGAEIYSPSVAWDGSDLLFCFILDNTGSAPLLHTAHVAGGVMGPVRWRLSFLERTSGCMVSAGGPGRFFLLTEEGFAAVQDREILLRIGDGDAFGAPQLLNSHADVIGGYFAADPARENVCAYWIDYENVSFEFSYYKCFHQSTPARDTPLVRTKLDCRPNPFNPRTEIHFGLVQGGHVRLNVYDARGRHVRTLVDEVRGPGAQHVAWDGRDGSGRTLAAGVYLSELRAEGRVERRKMLLLK